MFRTLEYSQRVRIAAPRDELWARLSDPTRHVELHPLIRRVSIREQGEGPDDESFAVFDVVDGLPIVGRLELPVFYRTRMTRQPRAHTLIMSARCFPALTTTAVWQFRALDAETEITEQVELRAPWPLAGYSLRQSQRSHAVLFANLQALVSGDAADAERA
ncbi:SRPBCC family protein [Haliangium ochraceum]|uniref:Polyketide cyclase/dehydrase n=1 Tax=Haliangium ochraceum (strain DSM 14365 / JCM 11303 / SMP-2) TaxID=502025 RepID=D0LMK4_HALO1|nr:SRPBCC family protein [Haliangium ochraceum]ACY18691.1 hypothetical protein Hoch_6217 [Haliangium ochraceum DSM 14365]